MARNIILLCASYFFYGYFNLGFTLILAFVTVVNYISGNLLFKDDVSRKRIVLICTVLSLLPLIFYKYAIFLCKTLSGLLSIELKFELLDGLLLPVGISFFTFQALSYTIDIYRGKITEKPNLIDFALFVAFFPTILSGPIEKARNLLPQIKRYFLPSLENILQGTCIFIWGLFKKTVVADRLANYVDWVYDSADYVSGSTLAIAALFYSIQIYCDFSGYSDMALGVAKSLGFNITKNFRQPYFSKNIKEFWRKWHIALTSWFTEYVYFSLGGNRVKYKIQWIFNISVIFILSGIWHGAAWNFLIWGILHTVYYLCEYFTGLQKKDVIFSSIWGIIYSIIVFILITVAWIFFRIDTFNQAVRIIGKIFVDFIGPISIGASAFTFGTTILMLIIFIGLELCVKRKLIWYDVTEYESRMKYNLIFIIPMLLLICLCGISSDNFVYFQF